MTSQMLKGIKVIDISTAYAGPYCSMMLADMGADVIKIEKPFTGDACRTWGPPFINKESTWFLSVNRNKKSVALDFNNNEGKQILYKLLEDADVFIENLKPSSISKFGLDYDRIKEINPNIIYCAISGFGQTGPMNKVPGYDLIAQAMSGLMSVTGELNGRPQRVGTAISDIVTGIIASFGITSALFNRSITNEGAFIDTALLDTDIALMAPRITSYLATGEEPAPSGGTDSVITIYQQLRTADEDIVVAVGTNEIWKRFCEALGLNRLINHPDFHNNAKRSENKTRLIKKVEDVMTQKPSSYWLQKFKVMKIPAAPILRLKAVTELPQVKAREMLVNMNHPVAGDVKIVGSPIFINGEKSKVKHAPLLGEHTYDVLRECGLTRERISALVEKGIIQLNKEGVK